MDFNATIDLIIKDLDEAREIIDDLKKYAGVPALQVELAKSKCKSAGEVIAILKNIQSSVPAEEKPKKLIEKPVKKEIPVKKNTEDMKPDASRPSPVLEKKGSDQTEKESSESTIIADTFSHLSNRFNEQLGNRNSDDDVSEMMKTKPLTSLSEAIGVNDKFHFIREIFNDNKDAYNQAISRLEHAENLTDAMAVIMSYTGDNTENEAVKQLLDLVKRKLPSNE